MSGGQESMFRNLKRTFAGISLVMLWLGFSLLGILSFINRLPGESAIASGAEKECCLAGSAASVFAGTVFFVAAFIYWRR